LIRKAGITDGHTIYQYSLGLTTDEYRSIALTNRTTLQGWYDAVHRLFNIDSHLGNINHNTRSEWDMDVDVITNKGLFELTVMFFGLRNSPATFQAMMDDYFRDMIDEGWIAIYMDDILIHARTKEDLEKRTKRVLERLKEHDLYLKPEKCKFERTEVEFLGTIISENTIQMDPIKLAGIRDWPSPTTVKQT
jgi:hypothetical protein